MPEIAAQFDFAGADRPWKMPEERFLHAVLMTALAANAGFQAKVEKIAARHGMVRGDKTFQPAPPKNFVRANNKKDADYRYHEHPRTGYSIDTIRNLCVCPLGETVAFFEELVKEFGGAVKVKVLYSLPDGERAGRFHLGSVMLTVVYEPGTTYGRRPRS